MRALHVTIALAMLGISAGCSGQDIGQLTPVPVTGVTVMTTHTQGDTAKVFEGQLTAQISGSWATRDEPVLDVTYLNEGTAVASVNLSQFDVTLQGEVAVLDTIDDVTGVDVSKPGSATPRPLMEHGLVSPPLVVPPGERRTLLVRFINFKREGNRARLGKMLVATIPLQSGSRRLTFRCSE